MFVYCLVGFCVTVLAFHTKACWDTGLSPPVSSPLLLFLFHSLPLQSLSAFDSPCVPPSSPSYSGTRYLHISRRGAVSLVAVVVALEYSCLASQHNSEIREPEHCAS